MTMTNLVLVQHAADTGRFHPAAYVLAPFPGPGPDPIARYKSTMHHTEGFDTAEAAGNEIESLCEKLGADRQQVTVREVDTAGADIVIGAA